jgi:hypothetical protein
MIHGKQVISNWFMASGVVIAVVLALASCAPPVPGTSTSVPASSTPVPPTPSAPLLPLTACVHFDDLRDGVNYKVPDTLTDSGATIQVLPFQWGNQTWTTLGPGATVQPAQEAGGSGQELFVNNVNLGFQVGDLQCVNMRFHEMGGNLNLIANNTVGNYQTFANGTLGGIAVSVTSDANGAVLTLSGEFEPFMFQEKWPISFAVGGQELAIDDVCPCETPTPSVFDVEVLHSPIVPTSQEQVTFTARVHATSAVPVTVEILVNGAPVQNCAGLNVGDTCVYTGGPYTNYEGTTVSYLARATDTQGNQITRGYYYFAVTKSDYSWSLPGIPARYVGAHSSQIDLVFHPADDYTAIADFIDDVESKLMLVYHGQDRIMERGNFDLFNFYVYTKPATAAGCGTVNSSANQDLTWRNVDAVLHTSELGDCTNNAHFSAEGYNTKAFLHESGHGVFGLADEYDGCYTYYFEAADEPNIFSSQNLCQSEQTAKGRDPNACQQFTNCQGGWWGIHGANDNTVMQWGMVRDPWGVEAGERVDWAFRHPPAEMAEGSAPGVILVPVIYEEGKWTQGSAEVQVLPCEAPVPVFVGQDTNPLIRILDQEGSVLYLQNLPFDPRVVLWPDPTDTAPRAADTYDDRPYLLSTVSLSLRVPLVPKAATLELVEQPEGRAESAPASLTVDLRPALTQYEEEGRAGEMATCQDPPYKPDALK